MSDLTDALPEPGADAPAPATAGAMLRAAREAAGLGLDEVARQLKLAPRQVVALESDDFAALPGRTFIRGFTRNYARLLRLDADALLAAQSADATGAERAGLAPTPRPMGELPSAQPARRSASRWAIPLVLVVIVAIAAVYEFARPPAPVRPAAEPGTLTTPLPLPPVAPPAGDAGPRGDAPPDAPATNVAGAPPATEPAVAAAPPPPAAAAPAAAAATLALAFRGTSWVEVRDGSGIVLSMTGASGATRDVSLAAPGELTVGNAAVVGATWRGKPLDLAPHTRQNVARVRLD